MPLAGDVGPAIQTRWVPTDAGGPATPWVSECPPEGWSWGSGLRGPSRNPSVTVVVCGGDVGAPIWGFRSPRAAQRSLLTVGPRALCPHAPVLTCRRGGDGTVRSDTGCP